MKRHFIIIKWLYKGPSSNHIEEHLEEKPSWALSMCFLIGSTRRKHTFKTRKLLEQRPGSFYDITHPIKHLPKVKLDSQHVKSQSQWFLHRSHSPVQRFTLLGLQFTLLLKREKKKKKRLTIISIAPIYNFLYDHF